MMRRTCLAVLLTLTVSTVAPAQNSEMSPAMRADIMRLLEITDAAKIGTMMSQQLMNAMMGPRMDGADAETRRVYAVITRVVEEEMAAAMPSLLEQIAPLYAKHFTHDEILGLIAFYETPLGQKAVTELPALTQEASAVSMRWGQQLTPRVMQRLQQEVMRLQAQ